MRIAIFGDVGGHYEPFVAALRTLGASETSLPSDLVVVQVGDLVHKGPRSEELVSLSDRMLSEYPQQWFQLLGNHEGHHVGGPKFFDGRTRRDWVLDKSARQTLRRWWLERKASMAVALRTDEHGDMLVTHAGLPRRLWRSLGEKDARGTALSLNSLSLKAAFAPGVMLGENGPAGVAWAHASVEVLSSWYGHPCPFAQAHGHSSAFWWSKGQWSTGTPPEIVSVATVDTQKRHVRVDLDKPFFGLDPGLGEWDPHFPLEPLIVHGEVL